MTARVGWKKKQSLLFAVNSLGTDLALNHHKPVSETRAVAEVQTEYTLKVRHVAI